MKRFVSSNPVIFGLLVALVMFAALIAMQTWFPSLGEAWKRNNRATQSVWFTAGLFGVLVNRFWQCRRRGVFWVAWFGLFAVHSIGVLLYSLHVHPLVLQQWILLLTIESIVVFLGLGWLMRKFKDHSY